MLSIFCAIRDGCLNWYSIIRNPLARTTFGVKRSDEQVSRLELLRAVPFRCWQIKLPCTVLYTKYPELDDKAEPSLLPGVLRVTSWSISTESFHFALASWESCLASLYDGITFNYNHALCNHRSIFGSPYFGNIYEGSFVGLRTGLVSLLEFRLRVVTLQYNKVSAVFWYRYFIKVSLDKIRVNYICSQEKCEIVLTNINTQQNNN